ncbi:MAG: hypothetical protein ACOC95_09580 [Planctomycetota bacterium]
MRYAGIAAIVLALAALPVMADNPWAPEQTEVPVTVTVGEMTELWTDFDPIALELTDGGAVNDDSRSGPKNLTHLCNVGIEISVSIEGDILDNTYFHVVLNPDNAATWDFEGPYDIQENHIYWLREDGAYGDNAPGDVIPVADRAATMGGAVSDTVIYAAQVAPNGKLSAAGDDATTTVVWTVAPQS